MKTDLFNTAKTLILSVNNLYNLLAAYRERKWWNLELSANLIKAVIMSCFVILFSSVNEVMSMIPLCCYYHFKNPLGDLKIYICSEHPKIWDNQTIAMLITKFSAWYTFIHFIKDKLVLKLSGYTTSFKYTSTRSLKRNYVSYPYSLHYRIHLPPHHDAPLCPSETTLVTNKRILTKLRQPLNYMLSEVLVWKKITQLNY